MGCTKKKSYGKKAADLKKLLIITLIGAMLISATTPMVFGATSDYIIVNFNPTGTIDISVNKTTLTYAPPAGTSGNYPTEAPTNNDIAVFNNGQVAADISFNANITTNSSDWTLDGLGTPGEDFHSFRLINNTGGQQHYVTNTSTLWFNSLDGGGGTNLFGVVLDLGNVSSSSKMDAQRTWVNFTGVPT